MFVQHWADGDLLLPTPTSPERDMVLLDVKTITSAHDPDRVARWLWQLLAYTWLDTTDRYRIRAAGLYLARHGALITWPIGHLAATLLGDRDLVTAAAEFRQLAEHIIAAETSRDATPTPER